MTEIHALSGAYAVDALDVNERAGFERHRAGGDRSRGEVDDRRHSVYGFMRHGHAPGDQLLVACNFTPVPRHAYRLGVPAAGSYREIINTDGAVYGGSGVGNGIVESSPTAWHGRADSMSISVPPLATVMWVLA